MNLPLLSIAFMCFTLRQRQKPMDSLKRYDLQATLRQRPKSMDPLQHSLTLAFKLPSGKGKNKVRGAAEAPHKTVFMLNHLDHSSKTKYCMPRHILNINYMNSNLVSNMGIVKIRTKNFEYCKNIYIYMCEGNVKGSFVIPTQKKFFKLAKSNCNTPEHRANPTNDTRAPFQQFRRPNFPRLHSTPFGWEKKAETHRWVVNGYLRSRIGVVVHFANTAYMKSTDVCGHAYHMKSTPRASACGKGAFGNGAFGKGKYKL